MLKRLAVPCEMYREGCTGHRCLLLGGMSDLLPSASLCRWLIHATGTVSRDSPLGGGWKMCGVEGECTEIGSSYGTGTVKVMLTVTEIRAAHEFCFVMYTCLSVEKLLLGSFEGKKKTSYIIV